MAANQIESGSTKGTILGIASIKNFNTMKISKSFPASSAINSQTVCRTNTKKRITNTVVNVPKKVFNKYLSRIFT